MKNSPTPVFYTLVASPLGLIGLAGTPRGLCRVSLGEAGPQSFERRLADEFGSLPLRRDEAFRELRTQLRRFFSGRPVRFTPRLDLRFGTPFQKAVWRTLRQIPFGRTRSYGSVAKILGRPGAGRAVGSACGRNPIPLIIPCHRVIETGGGLGGFTGGLDLKRRLLAGETGRPHRTAMGPSPGKKGTRRPGA